MVAPNQRWIPGLSDAVLVAVVSAEPRVLAFAVAVVRAAEIRASAGRDDRLGRGSGAVDRLSAVAVTYPGVLPAVPARSPDRRQTPAAPGQCGYPQGCRRDCPLGRSGRRVVFARRSEERRVGKEGRSRVTPEHYKHAAQ